MYLNAVLIVTFSTTNSNLCKNFVAQNENKWIFYVVSFGENYVFMCRRTFLHHSGKFLRHLSVSVYQWLEFNKPL